MTRVILILLSFTLLLSCEKRHATNVASMRDKSDLFADSHIVYSDDSVVYASWRNTGNGGTADDIDAIVCFKTVKGDVRTEKCPLLSLVYPSQDYSHHEIERIVSMDTEHSRRIYIFFLRLKEGSNLYAHDIVALSIDYDSLHPIDAFRTNYGYVSHISMNDSI